MLTKIFVQFISRLKSRVFLLYLIKITQSKKQYTVTKIFLNFCILFHQRCLCHIYKPSFVFTVLLLEYITVYLLFQFLKTFSHSFSLNPTKIKSFPITSGLLISIPFEQSSFNCSSSDMSANLSFNFNSL